MVVVEAVGDVEQIPSSSFEGRRTDSFPRVLCILMEGAEESERNREGKRKEVGALLPFLMILESEQKRKEGNKEGNKKGKERKDNEKRKTQGKTEKK